MSNKNRVNPDHYKVAGRDPQGEDVLVEQNRRLFGANLARRRHGPANFIPGAAPVGEAPAKAPPTAARKQDNGVQASTKRGVASSSRKGATSRHGTGRSPRTAPVAGASGRENGTRTAGKQRAAAGTKRSAGVRGAGARGARAGTKRRSTRAR
jgi:hypothetical protein